jgi:hypothetical protein
VLTQDRAVRGRYLNDKVDVVRFAAIDANTWDGTSQHLWEMLLSALFDAIKTLSQPIFDPKITYLSEDEKTRRRVQITIDHICQSLDQRLMIILDDFDNVLAQGPLHMIEQFNLFRSAGNRERLAYLVFTKRLPHVLGHRFELDTRCKFYDLFRTNIFALEPIHQRRCPPDGASPEPPTARSRCQPARWAGSCGWAADTRGCSRWSSTVG